MSWGKSSGLSFVDDDDVHPIEGSRMDELGGDEFKGNGRSKPVGVEDFSGITFTEACGKMQGAADDIAPDHTNKWQHMADAIGGEVNAFQHAIDAVQGDDGWKGKTGDAAFNNIRSSLDVPRGVATAAKRMSIIVDAFSRGVHATKQNLLDNMEHYRADLNALDASDYSGWREVNDDYNSFARKTMNGVYTPVIDTVSANHPDTSKDTPPNLGPTPTSPASASGGPGGAGTPEMPKPGSPEVPGFTGPTGVPAGPGKGLGNAAKGAGDAAKGAGDAAKKAAGQGANAAKQALGSLGQALKGAPKGPGGPPEGVLGLGPKGLSGVGKTGGAGGARGGGAGGPSAKPAVPKLATSPTKAAAATPVSRAGVSGQGTPGAGAPAAGNRGAAAGGTVHKANKALRNQRNGKEVVGDADAVTPVIGDEPEKTAPAKEGPS